MSLVAYYPLDSVNDLSGNGYTLTNTSATFLTQGKFGNCSYFNGSANLKGALMPTGAFSILCWIKLASQAKAFWSGASVATQTHFDLSVGTNQIITLHKVRNNQAELGTITTGAIFIFDLWQFLAVTVNGASWKIYYNGCERATTAGGNTDATTAIQLYLGCGATNGGAPTPTSNMTGYMEQFKLYNEVLTPQAIRKEYAIGVGKFY